MPAKFTVAETVDEFGQSRFMVEDEHADWVGDPYPTYEAAANEARRLNARMSPMAERYTERYGDTAVLAFVTDLMSGDPATLKAGYTRENAIIAAADAFGITREQAEENAAGGRA